MRMTASVCPQSALTVCIHMWPEGGHEMHGFAGSFLLKQGTERRFEAVLLLSLSLLLLATTC